MSVEKFIKDSRGSASVLAIGVMLLLAIFMSGILPMITQEVRAGRVNRDVVEAQYAAESGAKRALIAMTTASTDWSWLNTDKSFTTESTKTYNVKFSTSTSVCAATSECSSYTTPTDGSAASSGCYCIQSVGKVNGVSKTVAVSTKITAAGMPDALTSIVFGNANIVMNNSAKINGSAGTNGYISMSGSSAITGTATYNKNSSTTSTFTTVGSTNAVTTTLSVPTFSVAFPTPTAPTAPTVPSSTSSWDSLVGTWQVTKSVAAGNYSTSGSFSSGQSTITAAASTNLYVNGGLSLYQSTWTLGNTALLYARSGGLSLSGSSNMTLGSSSEIYATGFFDIDTSLSMGANSTLYAGTGMQLEANSTLTLPGAATVYLANNSSGSVSSNTLITGNNSTLNLGTAGQTSLFYCNGSANMGGTINIYGPTSGTDTTKVYFTGNFDMNNNAVLNVYGNVEIYVTGKLTMNNSAQINTAANSVVTFKAGGFANFNSNTKITSGTNSALALLIDDDVQFTNNIVINKAVVIATGNITMDSSASITGAVVSTGTTITMSNSATITTDADTVALVWKDILSTSSSTGSSSSSSSTGGIQKISWKSL